MSALHIEFEWQRDAKGYRLAAAEPPTAADNAARYTIIGDDFGKPERIVRRGGKLIKYRPLVEFGSLFSQFAAVGSAEQLLSFIDKFGPLTAPGLVTDQGEDVERMIGQAEQMKRLLLAHSSGRRAELTRTIGTGITIVPRLAMIDASLVIDAVTKAPKIQLAVSSLLSALWLQLGQAVAGGAMVRACQQCGSLFECGPGTDRRLDAKFCTDEHRIAFNSLNRSQ
jgi:hypothetical protein